MKRIKTDNTNEEPRTTNQKLTAMDAHQFISKFREAMNQAGNRPVQVHFVNSSKASEPTIIFEAAPTSPSKPYPDLQASRITIKVKF